MAKPYSPDLRERVVKAVAQDGLSRRQAAERFGVGASTVIRWMQRWRDTGHIEPGQMGGHRPKKIAGGWRTWLLERCRERAFTLRGLVSELAERGLKVDYRVVWAFVHAENLTHKKDPDRQRAGACRRRAPTRAMAEISRRYRPQAACLY
jgi:putative transposase